MRQRIWRRLFAAAAGVVVLVGTAAAQTPAPSVAPPPVAAQPAPGPVAPSVPSVIAGAPVAPAPGTVVVPGNGSVYVPNGSHAGTYHSGYFMSGPATPTRLGSGPNGCGSCAQDAAFVFGSCRSFFAPCGGVSNGHGNGCGHGLFGRGHFGKCINPVGGTGATQGLNPCCYDSYLNH
jgi:hypothetical protein